MGVAQIPDNIAHPAILRFSGFDGSLGLVRIEAMVGLIRNAVPVHLGLSGRPDRNISINRLNLAILRAGRPAGRSY